MNLRTPEQVEADEALTDALTACAKAYDLLDDGEMVMDYGCVLYTQSIEMMERHQDGYLTIFKDNNTSTHAALGLFYKGLDQVTELHGGHE